MTQTISEHDDAWRDARRKGIGGSDAAAVLGISRWRGPVDVYLEKIGQTVDQLDNERIYWGRKLENIVAEEFARQTGKRVRRRTKTFVSKDWPFMIANIDRELVGEKTGLECKTTSAFNSSEWQDDSLPDAYYCQIQHYCAVMQWQACYIACLIGGQHFDYKLVPRNEKFINDTLIPIERDFWQHVETRTPPKPGAADHIDPPQESDVMLEPNDDDIAQAIELTDVNTKLAILDKRRKELVNAFKQRIGPAAGLNSIATYKTSQTGSRRFVFKFT